MTDTQIRKINTRVYRAFPPTQDANGSWTFGELYYLGKERLFGNEPQWMLDGITPVGIKCVRQVLRRAEAK